MSEHLIRTLAKEYAGIFYEQKRSDKFRSKDSMTRARTLKQLPDGTVVEVPVTVNFFKAYPNARTFIKGHWPLFYDAARKSLITMLSLDSVSEEHKAAIHEAIVKDRQGEYRQPLGGLGGPTLIQRSIELE